MIKAVGAFLTVLGGVLLIGAWKVERHDVFIFNIAFGPTFIYLGLKMLV